MRILKTALGVYFVFLFVVLLIGPYQFLAGLHQNSSLLDRIVGIDGPYAVIGVICLAGGYMSIRGRNYGPGMRNYWPLIASIVSEVMFTGFSLFYLSFSEGLAFWQSQLMFGIPKIISLIGVFVYWPRRGAKERSIL